MCVGESHEETESWVQGSVRKKIGNTQDGKVPRMGTLTCVLGGACVQYLPPPPLCPYRWTYRPKLAVLSG